MKTGKFRVDQDGVLRPVLTDDGREIPDSVPMAPPIGFRRQQPLHERIRAMVQHEYMRARMQAEYESPEEADDFVIPGEDGDDPREARFALLPGHEWEDNYNPPETFKEMHERLVAAGWSPPKKGQEVSAEKPAKSDADAKPLDASQAAKNGPAGSQPA